MIIFSAYPQSKPLGRGCRIIDRFLLGNAKKSIYNDPFGPVCTWQKYVKSTSWFQHLTWSTFLHQGTWQMACFCGNVWTLKVTVQMDSMDVVFADSWGSSQSSLVLKLLRSNWSFDESVLCDHPWWGLGLSDLQIWHKSFHLPMENKPWALNQFLAKFGPQAHERTLSTDILFGLLKEADLRDFFSGVLPDKNHSHQKGQMMESWIQGPKNPGCNRHLPPRLHPGGSSSTWQSPSTLGGYAGLAKTVGSSALAQYNQTDNPEPKPLVFFSPKSAAAKHIKTHRTVWKLSKKWSKRKVLIYFLHPVVSKKTVVISLACWYQIPFGNPSHCVPCAEGQTFGVW